MGVSVEELHTPGKKQAHTDTSCPIHPQGRPAICVNQKSPPKRSQAHREREAGLEAVAAAWLRRREVEAAERADERGAARPALEVGDARARERGVDARDGGTLLLPAGVDGCVKKAAKSI